MSYKTIHTRKGTMVSPSSVCPSNDNLQNAFDRFHIPYLFTTVPVLHYTDILPVYEQHLPSFAGKVKGSLPEGLTSPINIAAMELSLLPNPKTNLEQ